MHLLAAALSAALASGAPALTPPPRIPPAVLDDGLEITGDPIAAQERRTRLSVLVAVNGHGPFRFLVDSGADRTVVGEALAVRLQLPEGPAARLSDMAGESVVQTVFVDRLDIGATRVADLNAPTLPERHLGAQGIIGIDALEDHRLLLDFDQRQIVVQDASRPPPRSNDDEIVVTARRRNGQLILTQVSAGNTRLYAIVDTGSEITLGNSALRAKIFAGRRPPPSTPITIESVTGKTIVADLVVLPRLEVGKLKLGDVAVAFVDAPPFALFGLADQPALLLGTDVLSVFRRVSLDFQRRKVRFQLRR